MRGILADVAANVQRDPHAETHSYPERHGSEPCDVSHRVGEIDDQMNDFVETFVPTLLAKFGAGLASGSSFG